MAEVEMVDIKRYGLCEVVAELYAKSRIKYSNILLLHRFWSVAELYEKRRMQYSTFCTVRFWSYMVTMPGWLSLLSTRFSISISLLMFPCLLFIRDIVCFSITLRPYTFPVLLRLHLYIFEKFPDPSS